MHGRPRDACLVIGRIPVISLHGTAGFSEIADPRRVFWNAGLSVDLWFQLNHSCLDSGSTNLGRKGFGWQWAGSGQVGSSWEQGFRGVVTVCRVLLFDEVGAPVPNCKSFHKNYGTQLRMHETRTLSGIYVCLASLRLKYRVG